MDRSVLFVPSSNQKAMAKANGLSADGLILDLEDALAPEQKDMGRAAVIGFLRQLRGASKTAPPKPASPEQSTPKRIFVRINAAPAALQLADIRAIASEGASAIVVPKVESLDDVQRVYGYLQSALAGRKIPMPRLMAMIETPMGILQLPEIAKGAKGVGLTHLIAGTNDLALALRCDGGGARAGLIPSLAQIVLVARAYDLVCLDGVYNDFSDAAGFHAEALQGKALGFDGKTLIHPAQIAPANAAFGPSAAQIKQANAIVLAYSYKKNAGKGAININGQMVERLHLAAAQELLAQMDQEKKQK